MHLITILLVCHEDCIVQLLSMHKVSAEYHYCFIEQSAYKHKHQ